MDNDNFNLFIELMETEESILALYDDLANIAVDAKKKKEISFKLRHLIEKETNQLEQFVEDDYLLSMWDYFYKLLLNRPRSKEELLILKRMDKKIFGSYFDYMKDENQEYFTEAFKNVLIVKCKLLDDYIVSYNKGNKNLFSFEIYTDIYLNAEAENTLVYNNFDIKNAKLSSAIIPECIIDQYKEAIDFSIRGIFEQGYCDLVDTMNIQSYLLFLDDISLDEMKRIFTDVIAYYELDNSTIVRELLKCFENTKKLRDKYITPFVLKKKTNNIHLKVVDDLVAIDKSIYSLYKHLMELELLGKKNSSAYQQYLDYLKIALEVEEHKLQTVEIDKKMIKQIIANLEELESNNDMQLICKRSRDVFTRKYRCSTDYKIEVLSEIHENRPNVDINRFNDCVSIMMLKMLNDYLPKANSKDIVIQTIYEKIYMNQALSKTLFANNFDIVALEVVDVKMDYSQTSGFVKPRLKKLIDCILMDEENIEILLAEFQSVLCLIADESIEELDYEYNNNVQTIYKNISSIKLSLINECFRKIKRLRKKYIKNNIQFKKK